MSIKKIYVELVELLETNQNKKVSSILEEVRLMCESKVQETTSMFDAEGNVIAIYCYYHKQWEIVSAVEYGAKASSKTGLNSMCKIGTSLWTKAQRDAKKELAELLTKVATGTVEPSDIPSLQAEIEVKRKSIDLTNMPEGYTDEAEVETALANS